MKPERDWGKDGFAVAVALDPPKGTDLGSLEKAAGLLKGRVDAVLVNDGADAIMRMSPLCASMTLKDAGLRPILGVNLRDRNRLAVQGDLLGAWAHGVRDLVFQEGKDPSFGDHPLTRPISDLNAPAMAEAVSALNEGKDLAGQDLSGGCGFYFGAAVEWTDDDGEVDTAFKEMDLLASKGAAAFVASPQFDVKRTRELVARAKALGADVFVSVMLLKSVGMARYLKEVPGIASVPEDVIAEMASAAVKAKAGIGIAAKFIQEMKGVADGVVIEPMGWLHKVPDVLDEIGR